MGKVATIGVALALVTAGAAGAQRVVQPGPGAGYPPPGPNVHYPPLPQPPVQPPAGPSASGRWGSKVDGRWWGGANAPGGWAAYRVPQRGWRLPRYWVAPRFYVSDWRSYGFAAPRRDQYWTRYYDDAVLIDGRGEVIDTVGAIDWDRYDRDSDRAQRGVGGAVAGAVVGGVAGNVIAGRGDKLGGTLIGAGVGAAAGYALGSDGTRRPPPPPPRVGYREPMPVYHREERMERRVHDDGAGPGYPPRPSWRSADGRTTVTVTTSGGAPVVHAPSPAYGYGYGGAVTTIVVQSAPVVTTTTTEIIDDSVTYTRPVMRRKRVWRPRVRARPACVCGS